MTANYYTLADAIPDAYIKADLGQLAALKALRVNLVEAIRPDRLEELRGWVQFVHRDVQAGRLDAERALAALPRRVLLVASWLVNLDAPERGLVDDAARVLRGLQTQIPWRISHWIFTRPCPRIYPASLGPNPDPDSEYECHLERSWPLRPVQRVKDASIPNMAIGVLGERTKTRVQEWLALYALPQFEGAWLEVGLSNRAFDEVREILQTLGFTPVPSFAKEPVLPVASTVTDVAQPRRQRVVMAEAQAEQILGVLVWSLVEGRRPASRRTTPPPDPAAVVVAQAYMETLSTINDGREPDAPDELGIDWSRWVKAATTSNGPWRSSTWPSVPVLLRTLRGYPVFWKVLLEKVGKERLANLGAFDKDNGVS